MPRMSLIRQIFLYFRYILIKVAFLPLERIGIHITPVHFYEPIPRLCDLQSDLHLWELESDLTGIDMNDGGQLSLLDSLEPPPLDYNDGNFGGLDANIACGMLQYLKPSRIIEVGSGDSTRIMTSYYQPREYWVVDPFPKPFVRDLPVYLVPVRAETVSSKWYTRLQLNDVLFIDSSHVSRIGGDVNFLYLSVLPKLNPGVVIHIHDIFIPHEYPRDWCLKLRRFWTEQYLLQAFLSFNREYEILWSSHYMSVRYGNLVKSKMGCCGGGSFWIRRVESSYLK